MKAFCAILLLSLLVFLVQYTEAEEDRRGLSNYFAWAFLLYLPQKYWGGGIGITLAIRLSV